MANLDISHNLDELVQAGVRAITSALETSAHQLRDTHIAAEAPQGATGNLARDWNVAQRDGLTYVVTPGEDAWYAHIVAGGRGTVRPVNARALTIEGQFRATAGPTAGNDFVQRALSALEQTTDQLIADALTAEGI